MKVVMVFSQFPSDTTHLTELARLVDLTVYGRLRRLRQDTVEPPPPPAGCPSRILRPVSLIPAGPKAWCYRGLAPALDEDMPDVLIVYGEPWRLADVQASNWARRHPESTFFVHACDRNWWSVSRLERSVRRLLAGRTLARADGYLGESDGSVHEAVNFGLSQDAVTGVIHGNPRSPDVFRPARDAERADARRRLGLSPDGVGVGFIGRLSPEKGPLLFLDALASAAGDLPAGAWATIAGSGPMEDSVTAKAGTLPVPVAHLGWLNDTEEVTDFYRAIDVLVVPSRRVGASEDQGPRAVIEAMLSGCPVVGTRVGALPQMLDGVGILVNDDGADLARGILRAVTDPSVADLRVAARARAIESYSGTAIAHALVDVWDEALKRRRSAAGNRATADVRKA